MEKSWVRVEKRESTVSSLDKQTGKVSLQATFVIDCLHSYAFTLKLYIAFRIQQESKGTLNNLVKLLPPPFLLENPVNEEIMTQVK